MKITVLGSTGFIGSNISEKLLETGIDVYKPQKNEDLQGKDLGSIVYCVGLTSDFRTKLRETVEAHVSYLLSIINSCKFDYIIYLSSTRIYGSSENTFEDSNLSVTPQSSNDLYNISKIMGESILFNTVEKSCILRLSNVYGNDFNSGVFLSSIIRDALDHKEIFLRTSLDSEKDYILVDDVVKVVLQFLEHKYCGIYNVASSINTSNQELVSRIQDLTGCSLKVAKNSPSIKFPVINIDKLKSVVNFQPQDIKCTLKNIVKSFAEFGDT